MHRARRGVALLMLGVLGLGAGQGLLAVEGEVAVAEAAGAGGGLLQPEVARGLLLAPKAFRAAVERVLPSLVIIETYGGLDKVPPPADPGLPPAVKPAGPGNPHPRGGGNRRRGGGVGGLSKPGDGPTTGVILSADGYIVTSTFNFLRKQPVITVVLADGRQFEARLLGRDETRKLCLLKVDGVQDLPVPIWGSRSRLRVGQWAISVGFGYGGGEPALSSGIISATRRIYGKAIQTDANISPANYGGPLLDIEGQVLGICVPLSPQSQEAAAGVEWYDSGIGFAIPLDEAGRVIEEMKAGKVIEPGKLGVLPDPAPLKDGGVAIKQVAEKSPAQEAGLKAGDVILSLNGEVALDVVGLRILLGRFVAGDEITLSVRRGGEKAEKFEKKVKLAAGSDQFQPVSPPVPHEIKRVDPAKKTVPAKDAKETKDSREGKGTEGNSGEGGKPEAPKADGPEGQDEESKAG